ncbi:hypothetical protein [Acinetobacter larvae]|uniref:CidA/LrgA family protein n=1 Tax=Acinetobacter larvae TaxID=1789224 RepID=A0A1B2M235_9GAMM|nr:hypothetical protein [Acinetobacter larvae]AOA59248.1 hypothetical protein BFG52_13350 [Acinetobacter larvae]
MDDLKKIDWTAWLFMLGLIVLFRETAVWVMTQFHVPELGNLVGLLALLMCLLVYRRFQRIPTRILDTNNTLMKESAFAFLPVCAGSLITLFHMKDIPVFLFIMVVSTLIPLWVYAQMAKKWL